MPMTPFYSRHRELAFRETRSATVEGDASLPGGEYGFLELYCDEKGCDCRRVLVQVLRRDTGSTVWATINFGWERPGFYRSWAKGDRRTAHQMAGVSLDPLNPQTKYATALLELFGSVVQDTEYVERLTRHYALHQGSALTSDAPGSTGDEGRR